MQKIYNKQAIIDFWFSRDSKAKWFIKDINFDNEIKQKFFKIYEEAALTNNLDHWKHTPEGNLALILVLDQFPRNMFRELARSYSTDHKAIELSKYAIEHGFDKKLLDNEHRQFLYMPFMHSEDIKDQEESLKLFTAISTAVDYAKMHRDIIKKFARFPHRNKILGRKSTKTEIEFLKQANSSF
jgi:uncharacterized protein (DUF924 family)